MPIASVKQEVADAINNLRAVLQKEYGSDFAYSILGNGLILAQSKINGVVHPQPIVDNDKDYNDGFLSGKRHSALPDHFRIENERKCREGMADDQPRIKAYWTGYAKSANIK
jgi:hypothetical protein